MHTLVCEAIASRRLLSVRYHDRARTVAPHILGRDAQGHELLRAFQIEGGSVGGHPVGWKLFRVERLRVLAVLGRNFAPRADFTPTDPAIVHIDCTLA